MIRFKEPGRRPRREEHHSAGAAVSLEAGTPVAIYARVSTAEQAEAGAIESQVWSAARCCEARGFRVVETCTDDGVPGAIPLGARPAGARLLADARAGRFRAVVVARLDRAARKTAVFFDFVDELRRLGVEFISAGEGMATDSPVGRLLLQILAVFAEFERGAIIERSVAGSRRRAAQGRWLGGIVPYGHVVNADGYLVPDEEKLPGCDLSPADVVRLCYRPVGREGWSTIRVADHLNALGVPPACVRDNLRGKRQKGTGGRWLPGRIRNMLVEPICKGVRYCGRRSSRPDSQPIERPAPALLDPDLREQARAVLRRNQLLSPRNARYRYLLRGLIRCELCNLNYNGVPDSRYGRRYYRCDGKTAYRGKLFGRCPSAPVPAGALEEDVWAQVRGFLTNPGPVLAELKARLGAGLEERRALGEKSVGRDRVLTLVRKGVITLEQAEGQLREIAAEETLRRAGAELAARLAAGSEAEKRLLDAAALLEELRVRADGANWETRRRLVEMLVAEIRVETVTDGNRRHPKVKVTYCFGPAPGQAVPRADCRVWKSFWITYFSAHKDTVLIERFWPRFYCPFKMLPDTPRLGGKKCQNFSLSRRWRAGSASAARRRIFSRSGVNFRSCGSANSFGSRSLR